MPDHPYSPKRRSWEFYQKQQEEALKNALNPELWKWLEEHTKEEMKDEVEAS